MATQSMNDSWSRVVNQIKSIWGEEEFGEEEIKKARGSLSKMVVLIHEKTGESKPDITMKIAAFL
ncbi:MAG: general stress protein CsbD [Bacteroidetes bacterium]|nr:general stress protein CsbD [Bacteroidota bacterium]